MKFTWNRIGWCVFLGLLAITLIIPYYYGAKICPPDKKFMGITGLFVNDTYYYMAIGPAQALKGKLFFSDPFGRVNTGNILLNPIANIIALIARVANCNLAIAFLTFRILAAWLLVLSFSRLARQFISSSYTLYTTVLIYCFGAGFGFLFRWLGINTLSAVDNSLPEANMFISMCGEYYIPLANALFILTLNFAYLTFFRNENKTICTGILLTILGAVYVYGMIAAAIIIAVAAMYRAFQLKNWTSTVKRGFVLACFCLPIVIYYIWLLNQIPHEHTTSGWFNSPSPMAYIFSFGLILLLALAGWIFSIVNGKSNHVTFLVIWILTTAILIYLPISVFPIQLQMIIGIGAPLSILCCLALQNFWQTISTNLPHSGNQTVKISATLFLLIAICSTNIYFYVNQFDQLKKGTWPEYISNYNYDAMQWCRKNLPDDSFVLTSRKLGLVFSTTTACKVGYDVLMANESSDEQQNTDLYKKLQLLKNGKDVKKELDNTGADYLYLELTGDNTDYRLLQDTLRGMYKEGYCNHQVSIFRLK